MKTEKVAEGVKTTIRMPRQIHRKLKAKAALTGKPMQDCIVAAIQRWIRDGK